MQGLKSPTGKSKIIERHRSVIVLITFLPSRVGLFVVIGISCRRFVGVFLPKVVYMTTRFYVFLTSVN